MSLFSSVKINNLKVPNRFFRSATYEALASRNGSVTQEIIDLYSSYKKVGLIMSSCTLIDPLGRHHPTMLSLVDHDAELSFTKLSDAVHGIGSAFGVQLAHSGATAKPIYLNGHQQETPKNMKRADIERVINNFGRAAKAARNAGADAVQVHAAGAFLVGSFLSKVTNNSRNDEFGSDTVEKRAELMKRIIMEIRNNVPSYYPVLVKINGASPLSFIEPHDIAKIAKIAENAGANAIEIAVNKSSAKNQNEKHEDIYYPVRLARKMIKVPIISTGGHLDIQEMQEKIDQKMCDMIGLSRPLIRQPNLIQLFYDGSIKKASCIQCDGCLSYTSLNERPLKCVSKK